MAMKKITFNADEKQLDVAARIAESKGTTLEEEIRQWLTDFGEGRWKLAASEARKKPSRKSPKD